MSSDSQGPVYDLLVVGGGINGTGIARDAAGRGLKVLLCEQQDLASATSSASSKLIHGGLRYLEHYEFRLVREALIEREVLLNAAPHIIWPLDFVLPHDRGQRPAWLLRLGLVLYDHLGGRKKLPSSKALDFRHHPWGQPLKDHLTKGFSYADCWVDDARLVVLNALDAQERGAQILVGTKMTAARRSGDLWQATLCPQDGTAPLEVTARSLVNAAGPWVSLVEGEIRSERPRHGLRLIKGSHIIVPALYEGDQAYTFQNTDQRVVFAIPYEGRYTLIGTTDLPVEGDPGKVAISEAETDYLCTAVNRFLAKDVRPSDVVWSYAGVRPLYDDKNQHASKVTRDYVFDLDQKPGLAPLLSIYGGKITTYRRLAEEALDRLLPGLGIPAGPWTERATLPGGDMDQADFEGFLRSLHAAHPDKPSALLRRYARAYGTRAEALLRHDLGKDLGGGLFEAEVAYLQDQEWTRTAEDLLWRRSKLGLHLPQETQDRLAAWLGREAPRRNTAGLV